MVIMEEVFNDTVDYTLKNYEDVVRLNDQLYLISMKIVDCLAHRPKNRHDLQILLTYMERMRQSIIEVNSLIRDMNNPTNRIMNAKIEDAMASFNKMLADS